MRKSTKKPLVRCPKCKNTTIRIVEHIVCPEEMYQTKKGIITFFTGIEGGSCYVIKWMGECLECGRRWRIRKRFASPSILLPQHMSAEEQKQWLEEN